MDNKSGANDIDEEKR